MQKFDSGKNIVHKEGGDYQITNKQEVGDSLVYDATHFEETNNLVPIGKSTWEKLISENKGVLYKQLYDGQMKKGTFYYRDNEKIAQYFDLKDE